MLKKKETSVYPELRDRTVSALPKNCLPALSILIPPIQRLVMRYLFSNSAARFFIKNAVSLGLCDKIIIDHITPRTNEKLEDKSAPFIKVGYEFKREYVYPKGGWHAHVLKPLINHDPSRPILFVDTGKPNTNHIITQWIRHFPETETEPFEFLVHYIACRVHNIEKAKQAMEEGGFMFPTIFSYYDGALQQGFSEPEMLASALTGERVVGTVFELIYRDPGLEPWIFNEEQADGLMKQSTEGR